MIFTKKTYDMSVDCFFSIILNKNNGVSIEVISMDVRDAYEGTIFNFNQSFTKQSILKSQDV